MGKVSNFWEKYLNPGFKVLNFTHFKPTSIQRQFSQMNIQKGETHKTINIVINWVSSNFYFLSTSIITTYIFTALNYTIIIIIFKLVPWMLNFNILYWDSIIKFLYFANTTKKRDKGWKEARFFLFLDRFHYCYIYFHNSHLYNYYNSSQTLWIKCWVSTFHTKI